MSCKYGELPKDDENEFYLEEREHDLGAIIEMAKRKWPGIEPSELYIEALHLQTASWGYDLYDSTDYTNFIRISLSEEYKRRKREEALACAASR